MNAHSTFTDTPLVPYKRLFLSSDQPIFCLVDERDFEWLSQWRWNYIWHKYSKHKLYARRNVGAERRTLYLHRELMLHICPPPDITFECTHVVDHINCNTLDNRRCNLRWVTRAVNNRNRRHALLIPTLEAIMSEIDSIYRVDDVPF